MIGRKRRPDDNGHAPADLERETSELLGELRAMGDRLGSVVDELEDMCLDDGEEDDDGGGTPQRETPSGGPP